MNQTKWSKNPGSRTTWQEAGIKPKGKKTLFMKLVNWPSMFSSYYRSATWNTCFLMSRCQWRRLQVCLCVSLGLCLLRNVSTYNVTREMPAPSTHQSNAAVAFVSKQFISFDKFDYSFWISFIDDKLFSLRRILENTESKGKHSRNEYPVFFEFNESYNNRVP